MTENTWPDPARPGVPLNPEKDGWHWLKAPDGEEFPCLWSVIGVSQRGLWPMGWISDPESWSPQECTYLGPCLTPAEIAAKDARIAELEGLLRAIEADCESDCPPSHGAIKYACRAFIDRRPDYHTNYDEWTV